MGDADKPTQRLIEHEELRDIHSRIDALQHETQSNHRDLTQKLHSLEVAVARGSRFPASAWMAAAAIVLTVIGTGSVLFSRLETANEHSSKALRMIEQHLEQAPVHRQKVEDMSASWDEWRRVIPLCEERVKNLENRIVGVGPNGWHRQDHEAYAKMIEAQLRELETRVRYLEKGKK